MNKVSLSLLIFLIFSNCSANKKLGFWGKGNKKEAPIINNKTILTKQTSVEQEFNANLYIKISNEKLNQNSLNNQNDSGELAYEGDLQRIGKYKFSKFNDFDYINPNLLFYNKNLIFYDNKGAIIFYDENQKIIWKNNFYNKSEKKNKSKIKFCYKKQYINCDR